MDILVLYKSFHRKERRTINDHLYAFCRYAEGCRFVYLDVGDLCWIPRCIERYPFDGVMIHYTLLAARFGRFRPVYRKLKPHLQRLQGVKVMIPHDEYLCTEALWQIARDCGISRIYCSCYPEDYATVFPAEQVGAACLCRTVLTGYVDDGLVEMVRSMEAGKPRPLDIGYRALESSYLFGEHGYLKTRVAKEFLAALPRRPDLRTDIKMTKNNMENMLTGDDWIRFLLSCRTMIGCLGGSSLFDPDGTMRGSIEAYLKEHPGASFEDVSKHCYRDQDNTLKSRLLGPKHFECAVTRTCQLLVEGDYHGVLEAGRDYIEVKKDFSNIDEVLDRIADAAYCERIAAQCYDDVVASGKYSYRVFANGVIEELRALRAGLPPTAAGSDGRIARMRAMAGAVHLANGIYDFGVSLAKRAVSGITRNSPALYERLRNWYQSR